MMCEWMLVMGNVHLNLCFDLNHMQDDLLYYKSDTVDF